MIQPNIPLTESIEFSELYEKLDNLANDKKVTKHIRQKKEKLVETPSEMWHLDTNLLDIDLDEVVEDNPREFILE